MKEKKRQSKQLSEAEARLRAKCLRALKSIPVKGQQFACWDCFKIVTQGRVYIGETDPRFPGLQAQAWVCDKCVSKREREKRLS